MKKKEKLNHDVVNAPTLFVGVGGTGSEIISTLQKMCIDNGMEMKPDGNLNNINFVCLDTNVNDLKENLKTPGHLYYVQTSNTQTVGSYLNNDKKAADTWFPVNKVMLDKTVSEGAGQFRSISRLALNAVIKSNKIKPLYDAIDNLFLKTGRDMRQAFRCCVVTTASGGTGSGIVTPIAMLIRDYVNRRYPGSAVMMRGLIMLPEALYSVIQSQTERDTQGRNAYATIKEINAFMMQASGYFDVRDELKRYKGLELEFPVPGSDETRKLDLLPFDFCFLLDGQNAEDQTLKTLSQYKEQAVLSLFEQNIGPMQKKAFSIEDNIFQETSNPAKGGMGRNRFGGIGAGVIRYPYKDIVEYVASDWLLSNIGEEDSSKWTQYDNVVGRRIKEGKEKGLSEADLPKKEDVYCLSVDKGEDLFSKNLKGRYLANYKKTLAEFIKNLEKHVKDAIVEDSVVSRARKEVVQFIDSDGGEIEIHPDVDFDNIFNYHQMLDSNGRAEKIGDAIADSIFYNKFKTGNIKKDSGTYLLECILSNARNELMHPNAMRYMLYKIKQSFYEKFDSIKKDIDNFSFDRFEDELDSKKTIKLKRRKTEDFSSLRELCGFASLEDNIAYSSQYRGFIIEHFRDYVEAVEDQAHKKALLKIYSAGGKYVDELNEEFEAFYKTFKTKVITLNRRKTDIIYKIKFNAGDSVRNVLAGDDKTEARLDEVSRLTSNLQESSSMLDSELNGKIFDAVKNNVRIKRDQQFSDYIDVEGDKEDIFDEVIFKYFVNNVEEKCADIIDKNVIEAIDFENTIDVNLEINGLEEDEKEEARKKAKKGERHILDVIEMGKRLSAPGIQRLQGIEERTVEAIAYNEELLNMRSFKVKEQIPNGVATDTVSKYELRFFNAVYNLTPDKLNKFACGGETPYGYTEPGTYHRAYTEYAKNIGPDSTKNAVVSTHIDKRWDAISAMPAIDMGYQDERVKKVHKALVYGLVMRSIKYAKYGNASENSKYVYRYLNKDDRLSDMVVSNGTLCDEFYEVLDALYLSFKMVEDIFDKRELEVKKQSNEKLSYKDTWFAKKAGEMKLCYRGCEDEEKLHNAALFEIPLVYANSLPNNKVFDSEIESIATAITDIVEIEMDCEKQEDKMVMFVEEIVKQFMDTMDHYDIINIRNAKVKEDNVVDIVFRHIKSIVENCDVIANADKIIESMRNKIDEVAKRQER